MLSRAEQSLEITVSQQQRAFVLLDGVLVETQHFSSPVCSVRPFASFASFVLSFFRSLSQSIGRYFINQSRPSKGQAADTAAAKA
ncbi:UNVERIFIED_ORG: hypothetical protein ABIC43_004396 [Variovorax guangxiensis]